MRLPLSLFHLLSLDLLVLKRNYLLLELMILAGEYTVRLVMLGHLFSHCEKLRDDLVNRFVVGLYLSLRSLCLILEELSPIKFVKVVTHRAGSNHTFKDLNTVSQFSILSRQVEILVRCMVNMLF